MSIEQAFLKDIVAHPDDDGPRLVYADWCDDHGDPDRAAFIRAQCRLRTMGPFDPERCDLEAAEADLLAKHEKKWKKPLAKITARCEFGGGFVERVTLPIGKFIKVAGDLFDRAPVRKLRVLQFAQDWDDLMQCEGLARLRALDLAYTRPGMARAQALAKSPHVVNLRELDLTSGKITNRGVQAIAESPFLANLRCLKLHSNRLTDTAVDHLTTSPHLTNLTSLDLTDNELSPDGYARLTRWEQAARIEELSIGNDSSEPEFCAAYERLLDGSAWPALRKLYLPRARVSERVIRQLAGPGFAGLRELRLSALEWDADGGRAIFESPHRARLEALDLFEGAPQPDDAVRALASSPMLASLRSLKLAIEGDGLAALAREGALRGLHEMDLSGNGDALAAVIAAADVPELRRLSLGMTDIGDQGIIALAGSPGLSGLRELRLSAARMSSAGMQALIDSPHLTRLYRLRMGDARFFLSAAATDRLRERFGAALEV